MIFLAIELAVERCYPDVLHVFRLLTDNSPTGRAPLLPRFRFLLLWSSAEFEITRCFLIYFIHLPARRDTRDLMSIFKNLKYFIGIWRITIRWNLLLEDVYNFEQVLWDILYFWRMLYQMCDIRLREEFFRIECTFLQNSSKGLSFFCKYISLYYFFSIKYIYIYIYIYIYFVFQ